MTVSYYTIATAHGPELALVPPANLIVSGSDTTALKGRVQVLGFTVQSKPNGIFLFQNSIQPIIMRLALTSLRGRIIPLNWVAMPEKGGTALLDPTTYKYLCALKPDKEPGHARLEGNRTTVAPWEIYKLEEINSDSIDPELQVLTDTVSRIFEKPIDADTLLSLLTTDDLTSSRAAVDAAIPFLSTLDLQKLGSAIVRDVGVYKQLTPVFSEDIWWKYAFPPLGEYLRHARSANKADLPIVNQSIEGLGSRTISSEDSFTIHLGQPKQLKIDEEFDRLSSAGLDGAYVSIPHACSNVLRKTVMPTRKLCMLTTARNEGIYLLEWIAYHRSIGVEWFYIYSNDNDDSSDELLSVLADAGVVTWIDNKMESGVSAQHKAYGHALSIIPEILDFDWCVACDLDEFVVLNADRFTSLVDYIKWQERREVDAIALNWRFMASAEGRNVLDEPLIRRNTSFVGRDRIGEGWRLVKSVFRPRMMLHSKAHTPISSDRNQFIYRLSTGDIHRWANPPPGMSADQGFSDSVNTDNACIYHFFFKSAEEWLWKTSRNRGDHPVSFGLPSEAFDDNWIGNFMGQHLTKPDGSDIKIGAFLQGFDQQLELLRSEPAIATAEIKVKKAYAARLSQIKINARMNNAGRLLSEKNTAFLALVNLV